MFESYPTESDRDLPSVIKIELKNNTIYLKKHDPFGYWTVNFDKGQMPERLTGSYLSDIDARKDVLAYLKEKGREVLNG